MLRNLIFCFISAGSLILAFPPTDFWGLSWIGLIPLMIAIDGKPPRSAFNFGYVTGIIFFLGTLYWFINMSASAGIHSYLAFLALFAIVLYLSCYFGLFAAGYAYFASSSLIKRIFLLPSLWVLLEFTRDWLFSGFGWLCLAHSQYKVYPLIQIADMTGIFGISFLIVMVNILIKEMIYVCLKRQAPATIFASCGIVALIFSLVFVYGLWRLSQPRGHKDAPILISIVQPNIPQTRKWLPSEWPMILEELKGLTYQAAQNDPDLIIWPETSFPGFLGADQDVLKQIKEMARELKTPILFGAIRQDRQKDVRFYNSAVLLSPQGEVVSRYDKMHLVPFGEYIPLRRQLPFLGKLIPILDFSAGKRVVLFPGRVYGPRAVSEHYAVLICFEDTIARVTRRAVRAGARLLVNITNDAWFLDTKEPFLHLQAAVFRAVENRCHLVRVANTGISCFIDPQGKIKEYLQDGGGKRTFVTGTVQGTSYFSSRKTFYTKFGDVFAGLCFLCFFAGFIKTKNRSINID